jgi:DNA-binding transcriptional regulator YhcF (GntR family)
MAGALRVALNLESPIPAYRQIANDLRQHLVEERLKPGDLLPPIRQLAVDLGVHFNTVALAYRMLAAEGWLELKRRRGAAVIARNAPRQSIGQVDQLLRQLGHIAAELRSVGMSHGGSRRRCAPRAGARSHAHVLGHDARGAGTRSIFMRCLATAGRTSCLR